MSDLVSKLVTADSNQFTGGIRLPYGGVFTVQDNLKSSAAMSMTITVQVLEDPSDGNTPGWVDLPDKGAQTGAGSWLINGAGEQFKVGCKTGDFTSGEVLVSLKALPNR